VESPVNKKELLPHLFRQEYTKMTAVLCRHFGMSHMEIAEDIASDTFLKASEQWAIKGVPDNPTGWLYTVARNKAKDHFKRAALFESQVRNQITTDPILEIQDFEFDYQTIADSQLAMIFAVCRPGNPTQAQICLALQILCGFSVEEIANAFLVKTETIKKCLHRGRTQLRRENFKIKNLTAKDIQQRLDTVLQTLYLLFNEGYYSKTNDQVIRKDLCSEALRLTLLLTGNQLTDTFEANALLALMCFQSSRLEARTDHKGDIVLFEKQDKSLWDQDLIEKGNYYLVNACSGEEITKYHLEAGIGYWHATYTEQNKWQHILQLYDQLMLIAPSPVTALNRVFAFSKVYGNEKAIIELEKTQPDSINYYIVMGYLHSEISIETAIYHYQKAISLTRSNSEKRKLAMEIERLTKNSQDQ
jgi:RNA polymerase sigma factor (sigma-70 family)